VFLNKIKERKWKWGHFSIFFLIVLFVFLIPVLRFSITEQNLVPPLDTFLKILCGFSAYHLFLNYFSYDDYKYIIKYIYFGLFISIFLFMIEFIKGGKEVFGITGYIRGIYHDPGQYSRMGVLGIVLALSQYKIGLKNPFPKLRILLIILCLILLSTSVSRNILLSLFAILIAYSIFTKKYGVVFLLIFGIYLFSPNFFSAWEAKFSKEINFLKGEKIEIKTLGSGRVGIWTNAYNEFKKANILEKLFGIAKGIGPHGQFIDLLIYVGVFGLSIIISFYFKILKFGLEIFRKDRNSIALYICLMVIYVFIMSIGSAPLYEFYIQIIFFSFLALLENSLSVKEILPRLITRRAEFHGLARG
jgi:hypothetical protein